MQLRHIYLLAFDSWYLHSLDTPFMVFDQFYSELIKGYRIDYDGSLHLYRSDGFWKATKAIFNLDTEPRGSSNIAVPEFWKNGVSNSFITSSKNIDYISWVIILKIGEGCLDELLDLEPNERSKRLDELFEAYFPKCSGERINPIHPKYRYILYIEPDIDFYSPTENIKTVAENIYAFLGLTGIAAQPHVVSDILIAPSIGISLHEHAVTVINLSPIQKEERPNTVHLPYNVWLLGSLLESILFLDHMSKRIRNLGLYKASLPEYVKFISTKDKLRNYEEYFLSDFQEQLILLPRINQLVDDLYQSNFSWAYESEDIHIATFIPAEIAGYSHGVFDHIRISFLRNYKSIKNMSDYIDKRTKALSEYFRDSTATETNRVNLLLQERIKGLTVITILLSIIALIIGFMGILPEESLSKIFNWIG